MSLRGTSNPIRSARRLSLWAFVPSLAIAHWAGCGQPAGPVQIPLGSWEGAGTFAYEMWPSPGDPDFDPAQPTSLHKSYPTTLAIRRLSVLGEAVVELEVRSRRGEIPELGHETHFIVGLSEVKAVSDSTKLFRLGYFSWNPGDHFVRKLSDSSRPIGAVCMAVDGDIVLQVYYQDRFADTYRFRGDQLFKDGAVHDPDEGFVAWSEVLRRVK